MYQPFHCFEFTKEPVGTFDTTSKLPEGATTSSRNFADTHTLSSGTKWHCKLCEALAYRSWKASGAAAAVATTTAPTKWLIGVEWNEAHAKNVALHLARFHACVNGVAWQPDIVDDDEATMIQREEKRKQRDEVLKVAAEDLVYFAVAFEKEFPKRKGLSFNVSAMGVAFRQSELQKSRATAQEIELAWTLACEMIAENHLPTTFFSKSSTQRFLQHFNVPSEVGTASHQTVSRQLQLHGSNVTTQFLKRFRGDVLSIGLDSGKIHSHKYVPITGVGALSGPFIVSIVPDTEFEDRALTAINLAKIVAKVVETVSEHDGFVMTYCTDNASNFRALGDHLESLIGYRIPDVHCFAHTIQLMIKGSRGMIETLPFFADAERFLVAFRAALPAGLQGAVTAACETRWSYLWRMADDLLKLHRKEVAKSADDAVITAYLLDTNRNPLLRDDNAADAAVAQIQIPRLWRARLLLDHVTAFHALLEPFKVATDWVQLREATLWTGIEAVAYIRLRINEIAAHHQQFVAGCTTGLAAKIVGIIDERFRTTLNCTPLRIVAYFSGCYSLSRAPFNNDAVMTLIADWISNVLQSPWALKLLRHFAPEQVASSSSSSSTAASTLNRDRQKRAITAIKTLMGYDVKKLSLESFMAQLNGFRTAQSPVFDVGTPTPVVEILQLLALYAICSEAEVERVFSRMKQLADCNMSTQLLAAETVANYQQLLINDEASLSSSSLISRRRDRTEVVVDNQEERKAQYNRRATSVVIPAIVPPPPLEQIVAVEEDAVVREQMKKEHEARIASATSLRDRVASSVAQLLNMFMNHWVTQANNDHQQHTSRVGRCMAIHPGTQKVCMKAEDALGTDVNHTFGPSNTKVKCQTCDNFLSQKCMNLTSKDAEVMMKLFTCSDCKHTIV